MSWSQVVSLASRQIYPSKILFCSQRWASRSIVIKYVLHWVIDALNTLPEGIPKYVIKLPLYSMTLAESHHKMVFVLTITIFLQCELIAIGLTSSMGKTNATKKTCLELRPDTIGVAAIARKSWRLLASSKLSMSNKQQADCKSWSVPCSRIDRPCTVCPS